MLVLLRAWLFALLCCSLFGVPVGAAATAPNLKASNPKAKGAASRHQPERRADTKPEPTHPAHPLPAHALPELVSSSPSLGQAVVSANTKLHGAPIVSLTQGTEPGNNGELHLLASLSLDNTVRLWKFLAGSARPRAEERIFLPQDSGEPQQLALGPGSRLIAVTTKLSSGQARILIFDRAVHRWRYSYKAAAPIVTLGFTRAPVSGAANGQQTAQPLPALAPTCAAGSSDESCSCSVPDRDASELAVLLESGAVHQLNLNAGLSSCELSEEELPVAQRWFCRGSQTGVGAVSAGSLVGSLLAVACTDGSIHFGSPASKQEPLTLEPANQVIEPVTSLALLPAADPTDTWWLAVARQHGSVAVKELRVAKGELGPPGVEYREIRLGLLPFREVRSVLWAARGRMLCAIGIPVPSAASNEDERALLMNCVKHDRQASTSPPTSVQAPTVPFLLRSCAKDPDNSNCMVPVVATSSFQQSTTMSLDDVQSPPDDVFVSLQDATIQPISAPAALPRPSDRRQGERRQPRLADAVAGPQLDFDVDESGILLKLTAIAGTGNRAPASKSRSWIFSLSERSLVQSLAVPQSRAHKPEPTAALTASFTRTETVALRAAAPSCQLGARSCRIPKGSKWELIELPAPVAKWKVVSVGKLLITFLADGSVLWHSAKTGKLLLTFFAQPNEDAVQDSVPWVAFTPSGYFFSGRGGEDLVDVIYYGNRENMTATKPLFSPATYSLSAFPARQNPAICERSVHLADPVLAIEGVFQTAAGATTHQDLLAVLPPLLQRVPSPHIPNVTGPTSTDSPGTANVMQSASQQLFTLLVQSPNARPETGNVVVKFADSTQQCAVSCRQRGTSGSESATGPVSLSLSFDRFALLDCTVDEKQLSAERLLVASASFAQPQQEENNCHTGTSTTASITTETEIPLQDPGATPGHKPSLYLLGVGVSTYEQESTITKTSAQQDAQALWKVLSQNKGGLFERVQLVGPASFSAPSTAKNSCNASQNATASSQQLLINERATRANIIAALERLRLRLQESDDLGVVFLGGHGGLTPDKQFVFHPYEYDLIGTSGSAIGLTTADILGPLRRAKGRILLILDTCHAGAISDNHQVGESAGTNPGLPKIRLSLPLTTPKELTTLGDRLQDTLNHVVIMASSTTTQAAHETEQHGYFTDALIDGLSGEAAELPDGRVYFDSLFAHAAQAVRRRSKQAQLPTLFASLGAEPFPISAPGIPVYAKPWFWLLSGLGTAATLTGIWLGVSQPWKTTTP